MTLIALTLNHGYPVMMADILISSKYSDGKIELPTYVKGAGNILTNAKGYKPLCLEQKLYVINDRLCVALGGRGDQMRTLLRKLKALYGHVDFDDNKLIDFVENYSKEESNELMAIVLKSRLLANGQFDFAVRCIGGLRALSHELYRTVVAGGSGAIQFIDFIKSSPKFKSDIRNTDFFLSANQSLIAYWLGQEVSRAESLRNHWGAGYEMISFEDGRFVKLQEYTVVLMVGDFGNGVEFVAAPISTMMVSYQGDVLMIRVFAHDEEKVFAVFSILDDPDSMELVDTEPKHETLLMTYILRDLDKKKEYTPPLVFPRNKNEFGKSPIVFKRVGGSLQLHKDSRQDDAVLKMVINNS